MTDTSLWNTAPTVPNPAEVAQVWSRVVSSAIDVARASAEASMSPAVPLPYDPAAPARAFSAFASWLMTNPVEVLKAQQKAAADWMSLMGAVAARAAGQEAEPVIAPERGDRRFSDPAWSDEPVFDYLKQAYLLASRRAIEMVQGAEGLDEDTRTRLEFFTTQYLNALSPANFAFTNPEAIRRAIETGSISLLSGLANLLADAAAQPGIVQRRTSQPFELGKDLAATPGSVVFDNELMLLIQYVTYIK
jgi:polyhydroxyalkanoate synthase